VAVGFSWSISRHDTFAACRRKYYYSYYGANEDSEIRRLKNLSALPLWGGSVVHAEIEDFLKKHTTLPGEDAQQDWIHKAVHERMVSEWRESEAGSGRFRLFEHEYRAPVEQEDKKILVDIVRRSLRTFFRSDTLREAFAVGREHWLCLEELHSFHVDGIEVYLRMDLAYRDASGQTVIVDWKTGRQEGRFSDVQVASYALYASEHGWAPSATAIQTELAYLSIPRFTRRAVDERTLAKARDFIVDSAEKMQGLLVDRKSNRPQPIDKFDRIDRPQVCRRCNFRRLCFPRGLSPLYS
jgi:CRISPR/Cas system-associated exonuclease Cas4 (RecB family)